MSPPLLSFLASAGHARETGDFTSPSPNESTFWANDGVGMRWFANGRGVGTKKDRASVQHSTHANFCQKGTSSVVFPTPFVERSPFPVSNRVSGQPENGGQFFRSGDFLMIFRITENVPQVEGKTLKEI